MSERGFVPFSAAGAIIVIMALALVAQVAFSRHQQSLQNVNDISDSSLLMRADALHADLQSAARQAVYLALSEVSEEANQHDCNARRAAIESLATKYFEERVAGFVTEYPEYDARIDLDISSLDWPRVKISESGGGYVSARVSLPDGSRIRLTSWDGKTKLAVAFENIEIFVDSRYFLLESCMDNFVRKLGDLNRSWQALEHAQALAGAFLNGKVELVQSRSRELFEAAWSLHELGNFGSSDYWAQVDGSLQLQSSLEQSWLGSSKLIARENFYRLFPPAPVKSVPGISVYHKFEVKNVSFKRQDPAGLLGFPTATPIPIANSGITVWWAQWETTVELNDNPVEKIFDFDNPTLPLFFEGCYLHIPLAYRWKLPEKAFTTVVVIFNIKPFTVFVR